MANIYAKNNGSATSNGTTVGNPTTLTHATQLSAAGDTIFLIGGTYNITATIYPHIGTSNAWITYRNYDATPPILNWTSTANSPIININPNVTPVVPLKPGYVQLIGLQINGNNVSANGIGVVGIHHFRVIGCLIQGCGTSIATRSCDYVESIGNALFHAGYNGNANQWGQGVSYNSHRWFDTAPGFHSIVANNMISGNFDSAHHTDGNGIIMDLSVGVTDPNLADTPPVLICNNVCYQNGGKGISALMVSNIWMVNNTCYGNGLDLDYGGPPSQFRNRQSPSCYTINNIAYGWNQTPTYDEIGPYPLPGARVYLNNKQFAGTGTNFSVTPAQVTTGDPKFVTVPFLHPTNPAQHANAIAPWDIGNSFELLPGSPCLDAGIDPRTLPGLDSAIIAGLTTYAATDIRGVARPQGTAWDMGAYEMAAATLPAPTITSISPTTGAQGATRTIAVVGANFNVGITASFGTADIIVNSTVRNSATSLTVSISIGASATVGLRSFTVTNTDGKSATLANSFNVTATILPPVLTSITPVLGFQGQVALLVTVTGTGFASGATASFSGTGITINTVTFSSSTQLVLNINIDAGAALGLRSLTITNPDTQSGTLSNAFLVILPAPLLSTVSPSSGNQGQTGLSVVLTGAGFVTGATVGFGTGSGITLNSTTVDSATQITVNITIAGNAVVGGHDVTVTNPDAQLTTLTGGFTVIATIPAPTVTSSTPNSGDQGATLTGVVIVGTGFFSGATVSYGDDITVSGVTFNSSTQLTVNLAISNIATVGGRTVIVTNPDAQTGSAAAFTVTAIVFPAPTVTSIAPVTALLGDTHINVVVTGTGFLNGILVSFGSGIAVNLVTFNSATQVTANISVAITATTLGVHDVTVVNPDLKAASLVNALLILPRSPAIASITPAQGAQASAVAVTILGSFFIEGLTVDFGAGTTVTRTIVSSSTRIDVVVSIASTATLGPRDVIVTNPGGQSATVTAGFAVLVQSVIPTTMDDLTPLKFMVEIPATVFDIPAASVLKRVSVDANTRSQNLMVSLVFDDGSTQPFFTTLNTPVRGQQEWAVSTTKKWLAVRIEHMGEGLVDLVEIFGVDVDVYVPTVTAALATAMKEVGK